jgi:hypothetical protein
MEALDFETEPPQKWLRRGSKGWRATVAVCQVPKTTRLLLAMKI